MGRKCAVPHCYTGYRKCKDKASLFKVPEDDFFLSKWNEAISREDRPINPKDFICEKHFNDSDIIRQRTIKDVIEVYQRPKLRQDAIPSVFPDLPDCIPKMVRKRRRMPSEAEQQTVDKKLEQDIDRKTNVSIEEIKIKEEPIHYDSTSEINEVTHEIEIKSEEHFEELSLANEHDSDGVKMHYCTECDYKSKFLHNVMTHKSKHLNIEAGYRCKVCPNFATKWKLSYSNHMKIKHGIGKQEIFSCKMCPYKTKVKICLKRHVERHNQIKCRFASCQFATHYKYFMVKHIFDEHKDADDHSLNAKIGKAWQEIRTEDCVRLTNLHECSKCQYKTNNINLFHEHSEKHTISSTCDAHRDISCNQDTIGNENNAEKFDEVTFKVEVKEETGEI